MATTVIDIRSGAYFDVFIGRGKGSILGNRFEIGKDGSRLQVIAKFRVYFHERMAYDPAYKAKVLSLKDKVCGCYCKPRACHGDVYVEYLDD